MSAHLLLSSFAASSPATICAGLICKLFNALCIVKLMPHVCQCPCKEPRPEASSSCLAASNTTKQPRDIMQKCFYTMARPNTMLRGHSLWLGNIIRRSPQDMQKKETQRQLHNYTTGYHSQHADANLRKKASGQDQHQCLNWFQPIGRAILCISLDILSGILSAILSGTSLLPFFLAHLFWHSFCISSRDESDIKSSNFRLTGEE